MIISWISKDLFLKNLINCAQQFGNVFWLYCFLCVSARAQSGGFCSWCSCFFSFLPMSSLQFWLSSFLLAASLFQSLVFVADLFKFFESFLKFSTLNFFSKTHFHSPSASKLTLTAFNFQCSFESQSWQITFSLH